jgi:sortase A
VPESNIGAIPEHDVPSEAGSRPPRRHWSRPRGGRLRALLRRFGATLPESRADRVLVVATLTAIILVGASSVAILQSTPEGETVTFDAPTLVTASESSTTTATVEASTSTTLPAAAAAAESAVKGPQAPPADPRAATPIIQIGEMRIPKIGLVHPIYEGVTLTVIDKGPGHWPGSAMPGGIGNSVFAGHRVTHSRPMRNIDQLVEGDEVIFRTNDGVFTYRVTGHEIVTPQDVHIVNPTPDATMTIFGCHPPGSAKQRYVVRGALVSSTPA